MSNVVEFPGVTYLPISLEKILENAVDWYDDERPALVIATHKDGHLQVCSSTSDVELSLAALVRAQYILCEMIKGMEDDFRPGA